MKCPKNFHGPRTFHKSFDPFGVEVVKFLQVCRQLSSERIAILQLKDTKGRSALQVTCKYLPYCEKTWNIIGIMELNYLILFSGLQWKGELWDP